MAYALMVDNDTPEVWGPYETVADAEEVRDAYVFYPETAEVVPVCPGMAFTGRPM